MVIELVGSRSKIVHRALPENDRSNASRTFRWRRSCLAGSRVALKEGLTSTVAYFERLLSDQALRAQLAKEATVNLDEDRYSGRNDQIKPQRPSRGPCSDRTSAPKLG